MRLEEIAYAAIHPAIGFARVGDSPHSFLAPEVPGAPSPEGGYKDAEGRIKRQGVRFRIYAYDADGRVLGELTAEDADIAWTVHVANKKAAWYQFMTALDVPQAQTTRRRNLQTADRSQLEIDPGPRSVSGVDQPAQAFDTGCFFGTPVYLGEISTDHAGALIFLGGRGHSASHPAGNTPSTFADNDGWHDDIADGPVRAQVSVDGRTIPCKPAWVASAPPDYGPGITSVTTLYDVLLDVAKVTWLPTDTHTSFRHDVLPIFERLTQYQWVNQGFLQMFGAGATFELTRDALLPRLASADANEAELRNLVFRQFRKPDYSQMTELAWPPVYGDAIAIPATNTRQWYAITQTQHDHLERWAKGDFDADWVAPSPPTSLDEVPVAGQPAVLDRTALDACLGGPFHPGCELTWPMRHETLYTEPFRVRVAAAGSVERDYGATLSPADAVASGGPLYEQHPGGLTRWMAVPWQTDTSSCRDGYQPEIDQFLPTFWPARVPNQVLPTRAYNTVMSSEDPDERWAAFLTRDDWLVPLGDGQQMTQVNNMITRWSELSIVEQRPGPLDDPRIPAVMWVASPPGGDDVAADATSPRRLSASTKDAYVRDLARRRR